MGDVFGNHEDKTGYDYCMSVDVLVYIGFNIPVASLQEAYASTKIQDTYIKMI